MPAPRAYAERRRDTLALLSRPRLDGWVATVGTRPYVVPLPIAWYHERVLLALPPDSSTARHLAVDPRVRIGVGGSDDCVVIEAEVSDQHGVAHARSIHPELVAAYATQVGREPEDDCLLVMMQARRVQAWRGPADTADRTLMHDGYWLVQPTSD